MKTVFIILDTLRRDYLRPYGNTWVHTPAISRIAEAGVCFDNHWVGSLPCIPARREFMTGRHNFVYSAWGPIEPFDDTFPRELQKRGVFSHLITDHQHYFLRAGENYHTAFNTWDFQRGNETDPWVSLVDDIAVPDQTLGNFRRQNWHNRIRQQKEEDYSGPRIIESAIQWLDENQKADNWFLQVEMFDPHESFTCPEKYHKLYDDNYTGPFFDCPSYDLVKESPEAVEHIKKCYAGLLTMTDHWVGKLLDKLQALRLWDDVMIVFTTDHGTMLAEHDYWGKNFMPVYNEIVRIPLIVKLPKNDRAGSRAAGLSQTVDLMPTFMDYFGAPLPPHVHGKSIRPLLDGGTIREDALFGYFGKATNITDGKHVYMRMPVNNDGGPLYAYTSMPTTVLSWWERDSYDKVQMGRYFGHTYNHPVYKIPAIGEVPRHLPGEESYRARHQLFDVINDPEQKHPMNDPALEKIFIERIAKRLKECGVTPEQYTRLGMEVR